jgi:hypothetical protein
MITPPKPEALVVLEDALKYPPHLVRLLPALNHSQAWMAMIRSVERAQAALLEEYTLHVENVNANHQRKARDEE